MPLSLSLALYLLLTLFTLLLVLMGQWLARLWAQQKLRCQFNLLYGHLCVLLQRRTTQGMSQQMKMAMVNLILFGMFILVACVMDSL